MPATPQTALDDEEVEYCLHRLETVLGFSLPLLMKQYRRTNDDRIPATIQELIDSAQAALDKMKGKAGH